MKLPGTGGILFGIASKSCHGRKVVADPEAVDGLKRAVSSMSDEAARYKGLQEAREVILRWLG
jgi:hypothetical protein